MSCSGFDLGPEIGKWIADYVGKPDKTFKMLYHVSKASSRASLPSEDPYVPMYQSTDVPFYADDNPIMLVNEKSVQALNQALQSKSILEMEAKQFRPNICVSETSGPWIEDDWVYIKINGNVFRHVRHCIRCTFTLVDPNTGTKDPNGEPLKTLKQIR
jgi:uncharacterized protein YcbX